MDWNIGPGPPEHGRGLLRLGGRLLRWRLRHRRPGGQGAEGKFTPVDLAPPAATLEERDTLYYAV